MVIHTYNLSIRELRREARLGLIVRPCLKDNIQITRMPTNPACGGMERPCLASESALSYSHTLNSLSSSPVETII